MRELSLFTGAGGGLLGTMLAGHTPIGYVEWDSYCQQVIAARIRDGILPVAPIFTDVREFVKSGAAEQYRGFANLVTAGFPCQPFSVAGKLQGADDERNMWPATADVIRAVRPKTFFGENVPGLISSGYFGVILRDLAEMGYAVRWGVLGASDVGAPHRRKRLWIVADAQVPRLERHGNSPAVTGERPGEGYAGAEACADGAWWKSEPDVGRVANGVASRVDRLKAIGNGQVPAVACRAWEVLA